MQQAQIAQPNPSALPMLFMSSVPTFASQVRQVND
jgi:hypothetical protein